MATTRLNPYLSFRDTAKQAMEFYQSVFGGELNTSTFGEFHASEDPAEQDKIMHAMLEAPNGLVLMASDTPNSMDLTPGRQPLGLAQRRRRGASCAGTGTSCPTAGRSTMPLEKAPWGDHFGMCTDKFGIHWLVNIAGEAAQS